MYAEVIIHNPKTRDCIMQKSVNSVYDVISVLIFLAIPVVFQKDLKAISCRIEWSLFHVHSLKHMRVLIFIQTLSLSHCSGSSALKG